LNFETPNPNIDFKNSPFIVNTQLIDWPRTSQPRRAGLSSFGVGGTNAHVIIEEAPNQVTAPSTHTYHLLNLSARSETSLIKIKQQLLEFLRHSPATSIADVCYTLSAGRKKFNHAWSTVVATTDDAIQALSDASVTNSQTFTNRRNVPVALAFPGQGSQHFDMGYELYKSEPIFAEAMDRCTAILLPLLKFNLLDAIFKSKGNDTETPVPDINQTIVAQPGIFAVSYATAIWLQSLGLTPAAMIGHSVGEFVAACLSGVFSLEDALRIVAHRAQSMQQVEPGNMLAVRLGEAEWLSSSSYRKYQSQVSLAAVNSPQLSVLSGRIEVIEALQKELELEGHTSKILKTSHAFHSSMMDCVVEPLAEQLKRIKLHKPLTKIVSTVTGKWLTDEEALSPDYWAKHLRETVRFSEAAETLLAGDFPIIIEAGPGQTVSTLLKQHKSNNSKTICSLFPHVQQSISHRQHALQTLGKVWQAGAEIQLAKLYHAENRYRVHLPGYPFERQRYWFDQLIQHPSQDLTTEKIPESSVRVPNECVANMSENQRRESEYNDSHQSTHYARNDEYSLIVQQVIRQQLDIMTKQLKFWTQR
ncbi:MAG: type I polyketide synthase, partial [Planctomycetes bacterium]|nr:type I polyketide synthase [Planctomycetota bacterium]